MNYTDQKKIDELTYIGSLAQKPEQKVGIRLEDLRRHVHILGMSGMGRSTLLEHMFVQNISSGYGGIFFDPYGDATERLEKLVPNNRSLDILYVEPLQALSWVQSFDLTAAVKSNKIIFLNIAQGKIGEEESEKIGKIMLKNLVSVSAEFFNDAKDFFIYIDEFPKWQGKEMKELLSQRAKCFNLVFAQQYLEQIDLELQNIISTNSASRILFRVGLSDAEVLAPEFAPSFTKEYLIKLPTYHMVLKTIEKGLGTEPIQVVGFPPLSVS